ncbi:MAG: tail fiber domain-containing protein [Bacteroidia bacterium]
MKKYILTLLFAFGITSLWSQSTPPLGITYQAVAIDDEGQQLSGQDAVGLPLANKEIQVQFSIVKDTPTGTSEYTETHTTTTDAYGMFTVVIGMGTSSTGVFKDIQWRSGKKFLKTELDIKKGKGYKIVSVQEVLSVPYAMYAASSVQAEKTELSRIADSITFSTNLLLLRADLNKHVASDKDTIVDNELQTISLTQSGTSKTITMNQGGGTILFSIADNDSSSINEIQVLSVRNDTIFLSNGGFVKVPAAVRSWNTQGNSGMIDSVNFIGTKDNQPLNFRVNNKAAGKIDVDTFNTFFGLESGESTTGGNNTGFGYNSLQENTIGQYNTAVGSTSLTENTTGTDNTAIGALAMESNTIGKYNTAIGVQALGENIDGGYNTAVGMESLSKNSSGAFNTSVGAKALFNNTTGWNNLGLGFEALLTNTGGTNNVAIGSRALMFNTTGTENVACGHNALLQNQTGSNNTANGSYALYSNTAGTTNTAIGMRALTNNTTGRNNVACGYALLNNTTGNHNTAIGTNALFSNSTGEMNTSGGFSSMVNNTVGGYNTATGSFSLYNNTSGVYNNAFGYQTLYNNTSGSYNSAIGINALNNNTTGSNNNAMGWGALRNNTNGTYNTAIGTGALSASTTGIANTAIGWGALQSNTAGTENSAYGHQSLRDNTTGSYNVGYGYNTLINNTSGGYNTAIGFWANVSVGNLFYSTAIGYNAYNTASNQVRIGSSNVNSIGGWAGWSNFSDIRVKKDIQANVPGLAFISQLRPVTYYLDMDAIAQFHNTPDSLRVRELEMAKAQTLQTGFIAQEVEKSALSLGYDFSGVDKPQNDKDMYSLRYAEFTVPLVKAVQELDSLNSAQNKEIETLNNNNAALEQNIIKLNHTIEALVKRIELIESKSEAGNE